MKKPYEGTCHCENVRFQIKANIDHVRVCNCSICAKRGALIFRVPKSDFHLLTSMENLALYKWGSCIGEDYFCRNCGILPFRKPSALTPEEIRKGITPFDGWAVNVRCLKNIDYTRLPIVKIDGLKITLK